MSYCFKKRTMQHLWQSVCESVKEYDESSKHAVIREILEEMGLEIILRDLQYLFNDLEYEVHPKTELDRTELIKQGEWKHFSWNVYEKIV